MNFEQKIVQIKEDLLSLDFSEDQILELIDLATEEAIDTALEELQEGATDQTLETLANTFDTTLSSKEEGIAKINKLFIEAYGPNAEVKKQDLILEYLQDSIEKTKQTKDLLQRYESGDPIAIAQVKAQEGNPDIQEVIKKIKE